MERRKAHRISRRLSCEFEIEDETHRGFVLNLSEQGAYLQTALVLLPGDEIRLHLSGWGFPECDLVGHVARRLLVPGPDSTVVREGVGLALMDPPRAYLDALALDVRDSAGASEDRAGDELEIDINVGELEEVLAPAAPAALSHPAVLPKLAPPPEAELQTGDTEFELSEDEWEALDPLRCRSGVEELGRSVLTVDTLVVGGGEMDDVAILLGELGVDPVRMTEAEVSRLPRLAVPPRLIAVSARSALRLRLEDLKRSPGSVAVAVADGDSTQLVNQLRRQGYDFVVRRPVDPDALRLLLARLTFRGAERREELRTPIGCAVKLHTGLRRRSGILLELSTGGCSLLCPEEHRRGTRLTVRIPRQVAGGRPLALTGRVVRVDGRGRSRPDGKVPVGLAFEPLSDRVAKRLAELIQDHALGPALLERRRGAGRSDQRVEPASPARVQRRSLRVELRHQAMVLEEGDRVLRVLFGTELSLGGVRIEPHPDLAVGDEFELAICSSSSPVAARARARVLRDDGSRGLALEFTGPDRAAQRALGEIMAESPAFERGGQGEQPGFVVAQVSSEDDRG